MFRGWQSFFVRLNKTRTFLLECKKIHLLDYECEGVLHLQVKLLLQAEHIAVEYFPLLL